MDTLLTSKKPIVSSIVVAQKHTLDRMNLLQSVLHVMGIRDVKSVSKSSTLAELGKLIIFFSLIFGSIPQLVLNFLIKLFISGMDSLMAVEIKQVLERDFDINMTVAELRAMTFGKLQELTDTISKGGKPITSIHKTEISRKILFRSLGEEKTADQIIIPLNVPDTNQPNDTYALLISGVEGVISPALYTQCKSIEIPVYALQYHAHCKVETFSELVEKLTEVN